jgi:hypothetical protein
MLNKSVGMARMTFDMFKPYLNQGFIRNKKYKPPFRRLGSA